MATTDLKFWDGSAWVSVGSVAGDLIRLPVAAADGKSQVNGADGLISIENTTPGGEAGMTFVTANDGTRWRTNVEEGLAAGQMTFYNAANEAVFTLRQNGEVILEQGGPDSSGGIAATEGFVRTLMNTFPLIDDGNDTQSSYARVDTDNDGPNMKTIYFGIGGQSVQNPDRILSISIDNSADEDTLKKHITAHNDYTPSYPQDLVTLSYFQANDAGSLPISSTDNKVTLSDDDGTFQIETGDSEERKEARVYVLDDGKFGVGKKPTTRFMVEDIDDSEFFYGTGFAYVRNQSDSQSGVFLINNQSEGNTKRGIWGIALEDGEAQNNSLYIYNSGVSGVGTDPRFEFTAGSTNNFIIKSGQLQTDTITTKDGAENDCVIGLVNNQVDILRGSLDVSPMLGTSTLNGYGLGSDGIVVESADVFTAPEGWDEEAQGDPAQQPDQPRSGIAFKGPYSIDNETQNYYASIEGVRGGRTDGYKSGACRISVNSTGSATPSMQQAAYFGWDQAVIKAGNDSVVCNTKWTSQAIINQCSPLIIKPATEAATGYLDFDYYDDSRASCIGWYAKDYGGGTVASAGAGSSFFWANGGNVLSLAGDGIRINSQATGALTQYQWEFTTEGHLVSRGGQIQTDTITTKDAATGDVITYLAGTELRVNTAIEKPDSPGTYARSNTLIVDQNSLQVMSSLNIGDDSLAPANIKIGYPSPVGSNNTFGAVQWTCWDDSSNQEVIALAEVAMDATAGAGGGNEGELVFKTKKREVDGTTERLRITDNDIKAQDGYEPQTDNSLINKKYCDDEISQAIAGSGGDTTVVEGTPTSSTEPDAAPGSMMFDLNFLYLKTSTAGWRKVPLMAFNDASAVASVTVQMTQAQYDALGTKDPSTLYVIVG